ncbi:hypothetical protein [Sutcliffiella deserti]|uniref:hypothetical protein n=1 Tax=Sutcliffiella deserti TaxID=2875501 RepID=UPI001CBB01E3|nr:hypothetical protein [Sutcliffiella deserti]
MLYRNHSKIGTAWIGTHVIVIRCNFLTDELLSIYKSDHAPIEPVSPSCTETLSRLMSIGYQLNGAFPLNTSDIQYVLIYK